MAETLPVTRTTTSDASEGPSTCADLVAMLKAPETPPSSPMLEGETPVETFFPKRRRWRMTEMTAPTHQHPTILII